MVPAAFFAQLEGGPPSSRPRNLIAGLFGDTGEASAVLCDDFDDVIQPSRLAVASGSLTQYDGRAMSMSWRRWFPVAMPIAAVAALMVVCVGSWTEIEKALGGAAAAGSATKSKMKEAVVPGGANAPAQQWRPVPAVAADAFKWSVAVPLVDPGPQMCNASAPLPPPRIAPRAFALNEEWTKRCQDLEDHPNGAKPFTGRNWCWAWMKYQGCLWTKGHWSWWEAQERLSKQGLAPDPRQLPFRPILNAGLCERPVLGGSTVASPAQRSLAARWVAKNVAVYVLTLPSATARWEQMSARLRRLGLTAERVFGVDMTAPGALGAARVEGLVPPAYGIATAQSIADDEGMGGLAGTVGVAAGHFRALGRAIAGKGEKPMALILEDDSELQDDFAIRLWRLLAEAPCDWAAISLKSRCAYGECVTPHLTRVRPDGNEPAERCHHGVNYGFYAMLYRVDTFVAVRDRLRDVVWRDDRPHCLDIDIALASISGEVPYYAVPSVQQPGFLLEGHQGSARYAKNSVRLIDMAQVPGIESE